LDASILLFMRLRPSFDRQIPVMKFALPGNQARVNFSLSTPPGNF